MKEDKTICRLCLKVIENGAPYLPLRKNNSILENLNLISPFTVKDLELSENPVICNPCDSKLKHFTSFKENVISNEYQIQCNQIENSNSFIEAISTDFNNICRLCLKTPEDPAKLETDWRVMEQKFIKFNIILNSNILNPSKICDICAATLNDMWNFILDCSEKERLTVDQTKKKEHLTIDDLLVISSNKEKIFDKIGEDNNNVSQKEKNQKQASSSKNVVEIKYEVLKWVKTSSEKGKNHEKYENTTTEKVFKEVEKELKNLNEYESNQDQKACSSKYPELSCGNIVNNKASDDDCLVFNRTPKTYTRTSPKIPKSRQVIESTSKFKISSNTCIQEQSQPSTSKLANSSIMIDHTKNGISDSSEHICIDISPVTNVSDVTLDVTLGRIIRTESTENDKNVTQELIELLEETEEPILKSREKNNSGSSNQYRDAEELLRILEDDSDGGVVVEVDEQIKQLNRGQEKYENLKPFSKRNDTGVKKSGVVETSEKLAIVKEISDPLQKQKSPKFIEAQTVKKVKGKNHNISVKNEKPISKSKNASKATAKGKKVAVEAGEIRHSLRQKTIVMSFREMLNMKPLKEKVAQNTVKGVAEATKRTEKIQQKEMVLEDKKNEECQTQTKSSTKKMPGKKMQKNVTKPQETDVSHQQSKTIIPETKKNSSNIQEIKELSKQSQHNATVSHIEKVSFEKVQMQEISLLDEKTKNKPQIQTKPSLKKGAIKRASKKPNKKITEFDGFDNNKTVTNNLQNIEKATVTMVFKESRDGDVQEDSGVVEKKGKRKAIAESEESVPRKRGRKSPQEKMARNNKEFDALKEETISESKQTSTDKHAGKNEDVTSQNTQNTDPEGSNDNNTEALIQPPDKDVVVTIIRRRKTKNKAERDKTWLELTGKPIEKEELPQTDNIVKKNKRGRPPLPSSQKRPKTKPMYYMCDNCSFKTISQNIIIQHQYIHNVVDEVVQHRCGQCEFRTTSVELLEQHKGTHLSLDMMYKCVFCEYTNKKKNSTMYHTLHHEDKDISNMFYCLVVNQMTEEETYECFQCDYQNPEEAFMPDHVIDHQVESIKNTIVAKFSCKECLYKTKSEELFKRHQNIHEETRKVKPRRKKKKEILENETKKEPEGVSSEAQDNQTQDDETREKEVYSCNLCSYVSYNKRSLSNHKGLKHTRYEPADTKNGPQRKKPPPPQPGEIYRCNECPYTTQRKPYLSRHMLVHKLKENMEFFECTYCIFETKHRRSYTRHMEAKHKVIV